jgi:hypothetical protein
MNIKDLLNDQSCIEAISKHASSTQGKRSCNEFEDEKDIAWSKENDQPFIGATTQGKRS